jgi:hypothetical protein
MATLDKDRVVLSFIMDIDLVEAFNDVRAHDPTALSWVLFFTSAPIDDDTALVTVAITRTRYEFLLDAMEGVADYVPNAIEAEIQAEACELAEMD